MSSLRYVDKELYLDDVSLKKIADQFGTPTYVYSRTTLENNWHAFNNAFATHPHLICYSVKANSNLTILNLLAGLNSGFDIVSVGELHRVLKAGGAARKIIFSGVGKRESEIESAIEKKIYCFNVESAPELIRLQTMAAKLKSRVNIAFRINPNVDPETHAHISTGLNINKFGIDIDEIIPLCKQLSTMSALRLIGIACHIGSQIVDLKPFLKALDRLLLVYQEMKTLGFEIEHINVGGGLGITYHQEKPPNIYEYARVLQEKMKGYPLEIILEPGRAIVGNAGILLTRVEYLKHTHHKNFVIVDAGMNDLLRPALYNAWQEIIPVSHRDREEEKNYDIAGPICESADFLGRDRKLAIRQGDLLVINSAGAYGFSMSSNYNSRPRPAEVLIDRHQASLIHRRETIDELYSAEALACL
jgi:diaminopimelate decarboxylase